MLVVLLVGIVWWDVVWYVLDGCLIVLWCYMFVYGMLCGMVLFFYGGGFVVGLFDSYVLIIV